MRCARHHHWLLSLVVMCLVRQLLQLPSRLMMGLMPTQPAQRKSIYVVAHPVVMPQRT